MKIDYLTYFKEAARFQHLGQASKSLNISISSISYAIRQLEHDLGCKLFVKKGKNIVLTDKGRQLSEMTGGLFDHIDTIRNTLLSDQGNWEGKYRVGTSPGLDTIFFLPGWSQFQNKYPDLILQYSSHRSSTIVELVSKGELDFGVCFDPVENSFIDSMVLKTDPHLITFRKNHPITKKKRITMKSLMEYTSCSPQIYPGIEPCKQHRLMDNNNLVPKIDFVFDSYITAAHRLAQTNSWCYLPQIFAQHFNLKQIRLKDLNAEVQIKIIWPSSRPLSKAIKEFIKTLQ